jgi:hypothetical protein
VPSGKKSRAARQAAQAKAPPPVRSKGARGVRETWLRGDRLWWSGGGLAAIVVVVVAIVLASGGSGKPVHVDFAQLAGLQSGPPPWNNDIAALPGRLAGLHLDSLTQQGSVEHIHQHLDVYVNGAHVTVPAGIGIYGNSFITELHTHATDDVIHLESPTNRAYTLGQFFGEWGVRLTASCLGRYCGDLHWWVNGKEQTGDPADLLLGAHQEIVIAAGKPPAHVPASFNFPPGE